jgi:hypothetical protein
VCVCGKNNQFSYITKFPILEKNRQKKRKFKLKDRKKLWQFALQL